MDKLQLTGQNLGRVFNIRSGHLHAAAFLVASVKLPNLELKTRSKQLLCYLPLDIALPDNSKLNNAQNINPQHYDTQYDYIQHDETQYNSIGRNTNDLAYCTWNLPMPDISTLA